MVFFCAGLALTGAAFVVRDLLFTAEGPLFDSGLAVFLGLGFGWMLTMQPDEEGPRVSRARQNRDCAACSKPNVDLRCERCKSVWYCNSECQAASWPNHQSVCKDYLSAVQERDKMVGRARDFFEHLKQTGGGDNSED